MHFREQVIEAAHREARLKLIEQRAFEILKVSIMDASKKGADPQLFLTQCYDAAKAFTEYCEKERANAR